MIAKLIAWQATPPGHHIVDWKQFLPERFQPGVMVSDIPSEAKQIQIRRGLSAMLDNLAREFGVAKR